MGERRQVFDHQASEPVVGTRVRPQLAQEEITGRDLILRPSTSPSATRATRWPTSRASSVASASPPAAYAGLGGSSIVWAGRDRGRQRHPDLQRSLGRPQLTGDRPACGHECLVIAHQTRRGRPIRKRWNGGGKQGVYWHAIAPDQGRCHPAQKPLGLSASWSPTSPSRASSCAIRMPAAAPRAPRAHSSAGASSAGSAMWPWPRWRSAGSRDCGLSRCRARSRCLAE